MNFHGTTIMSRKKYLNVDNSYYYVKGELYSINSDLTEHNYLGFDRVCKMKSLKTKLRRTIIKL